MPASYAQPLLDLLRCKLIEHVLVTLLRQADSATNGGLLEQRVPIDVRLPGCGVPTYLEHPVELSLLDLAILMMIVSDNTATNICIERAGMARVNDTIADFGLSNTVLRRAMQDHRAIAEGRENVTTPNDLVSTFAALHAGRPTETTAKWCVPEIPGPINAICHPEERRIRILLTAPELRILRKLRMTWAS